MKKYEIDMSRGSVPKNLILFSVPLILSSILQLLFNAADVIVVGKFDGQEALAAVGSTTSLINLILNVFVGYCAGAAVVISKHFGANDGRRTQSAVNTAITIAVIFGALLMFVGVLFGKTFLTYMSCPDDVLDDAALYLKIYFLGMPAFMLYNFGSAVLRAIGDTRRPLYYLTVAGVVNVLLNLFFVLKLRMGVAGVAVATAIAQCISAFLVIRTLIKCDGIYRFNPKCMGIDKKEFISITRIGLPAGIQGSLFSVANVLIQSQINGFGSVAMAGNAAAANLEGFAYVTFNSMYHAIVTFTGQNLGAGKLKRIKKGIFTALGLQLIIAILVAFIVRLFADSLVSLYASDPEVIQIGVNRLFIICMTYFLCGFNEVVIGALRGLGRSLSPMIVSIFAICGLRVLYVSTVFKMFNTLESLYLTYPLSWFVSAFITGIIMLVVLNKLIREEKE